MRSVPIAAIGVPMVGEVKAVANHVCLLRVSRQMSIFSAIAMARCASRSTPPWYVARSAFRISPVNEPGVLPVVIPWEISPRLANRN